MRLASSLFALVLAVTFLGLGVRTFLRPILLEGTRWFWVKIAVFEAAAMVFGVIGAILSGVVLAIICSLVAVVALVLTGLAITLLALEQSNAPQKAQEATGHGT